MKSEIIAGAVLNRYAWSRSRVEYACKLYLPSSHRPGRNATRLASASYEETVKIWDPATNSTVLCHHAPSQNMHLQGLEFRWARSG